MTDDTPDDTVPDDTPPETTPTDAGRDERDPPADDSEPQTDETDDQAPLSDLARRVSERRARASSGTETGDELFDSVQVSELDSEDVWTALVDDEVDGDEAVGVGADAKAVEVSEGFSDHIVPKAEFCQRCEYLAEPPTLSCLHDRTTIVEVADGEHFRVRNCPMVEDDD